MTNNDLKLFINEIQKKYNYKKVILFGSRARGDNREDSDIDLLIEFDPKNKSLFTIAKIINDIQNKFNLKVDIVSYPIIHSIAGLNLNIDKEEVLYG